MRHWSLLAVATSAVFVAVPALAADPLQTVTAYLGAWNAHDAAKAAALFAPGVTYYDASVGTPVTGAQEAKAKVIDAFLTAVPDAAWQPVGTPLAQGDQVAFEWTFKGTNTGPWSDGTKATGKPVDLHGMSMFTVTDGHITAQSDYYDALGFYKSLGLM